MPKVKPPKHLLRRLLALLLTLTVTMSWPLAASADTVTPQKEKEIGQRFHLKVAAAGVLMDDPIANKYYKQVASRILKGAGLRPDQYNFYIIRSDGINAFAVPGDVNFWPNLTGGEIIDLLGNLRGVPRDDATRETYESRRAELLEKFQLDPRKKFRTYSKGNRQKVAVVAALSSDVPLYILDEPTSGLDPLMEQTFQNEIRELKNQGKTILLSSHILSEAEALCDRVTIIRSGKDAGVYTLNELKKESENLERIFLSKYEEEQ